MRVEGWGLGWRMEAIVQDSNSKYGGGGGMEENGYDKRSRW